MTTATLRAKSADVSELLGQLDAIKVAAVQRLEWMRDSIVRDGKPVSAVELAEALREAELKPKDFEDWCDELRDRLADEKIVGELPALYESSARQDEAIQAEVDSHEQRMRELLNGKASIDDRIKCADRAGRRMRKTKPHRLQVELAKVDRPIGRARKILAKQLGPAPEWPPEARVNRERRIFELEAQQAEAALVVRRLQPISNALRALAYKAQPSEADIATALATPLSANV